jgi:2-desacetyl-2-hydroxyethyl bacteriochlorophyllide A dehydrogenase
VRAVVIERPREVSLRDVEMPFCGPDDVLVRSHLAGVCRTDLEIATGALTDSRWIRFPCIPGHEWSGSVAEVGRNVADLSPGERVVCEGIIPCNRCRRCKAGRTQLCENYDQIGFSRGGGYGEFVVAPRRVVHRLPDAVPFDSAVLIEPAACVWRGLGRAKPKPGETIGVIGIGTLGALALSLSQLFSPGELVAFGLRDDELALARRLGADGAVNVADDPGAPFSAGLDVVVETAGAVEAVELATRLVRPGGRVVLLGIAGEGRQLELPSDRIVLGDLDVIGSFSYTTAAWVDVMRLLETRRVDFAPLITHRFPLESFGDAFELLGRPQGTVVKIVLEHEHEQR